MSSDATGSTRAIEWLAWLEVNKKKLLIGVIVIAVIGGAIGLYRARIDAVEREGWTAFFKAVRPGSRSDLEDGAQAQALLDVATAHPNTGAGIQAQLFAGQALFEQGKYSEARRLFENFIRQHGESEFAVAASLGVAASLDSENKTNEAFAAYQSVVSQYQNSAVANQAKLAIARIHESRNDPAPALKIYEELARSAVQNAWGADATLLRDHLLLMHPELAATNQPAPVSGTATNIVRVLPTNSVSGKP